MDYRWFVHGPPLWLSCYLGLCIRATIDCIDQCVHLLWLHKPRTKPRVRLRRRPPWRYPSLGYPASWLILSALMIPATSVAVFQDQLRLRSKTFRPCEIHTAPPTAPVVPPTAPPWDTSSDSADATATPIPPRFLHLSGFGPQYDIYCKQHIHEDLDVARAHSTPELPDITTNYSVQNIAFTATSHSQLDPTFLPNVISSRVCFTQKQDSDILPIIFDTGCSYAMTFDPNDFEVPPLTGNLGHVNTASGTLDITGFGIIRWRVQTTDGTLDEIRIPGHLIPGCNQRLLSPQDYGRFHHMFTEDDTYGGTATNAWLRLASGKILCCNVDPLSNIPVVLATHPSATTTPPCACSWEKPNTCHQCSTPAPAHVHLNILDDANRNLTGAQKELLLDHQRLGHINFQHLQSLYRPHSSDPFHDDATTTVLDDLPSLSSPPCCLQPRARQCSSCPRPKCQACLLANSKRRARPHQHRTDDPDKAGILSANAVTPGSQVSVDHYESSVRGRLLTTRGREPERTQYCGGTIFVDHASGLVHVEHQVSLGGPDTIRSKTAFEQMAHEAGVKIQSYHADNGVFTADAFTSELRHRGQTYTLSGVGAHHQNGRAERAIQTVVWKARAMMIHQQLMWPEGYNAKLWPSAMTYAAFIYNHTPRQDTGLAPIEIFTGIRTNCNYLRRCRVWGSPTYVLAPKLQDGRKIPKWRPRARMGQFLGFSPRHSSTVGLIRNLQTGSISPQYHIVVDEKFETVASSRKPDLEKEWEVLFQTARDCYLEDHDPDLDGPLPPLADEWLHPDEVRDEDEPRPERHRERIFRPQTTQPARPPQQAAGPPPNNDAVDELQVLADDTTVAEDDEDDDPDLEQDRQPPDNNEAETAPRRGNRERRNNPRFTGDDWLNHLHWRKTYPSPEVSFALSIDWDTPPLTDTMSHFESLLMMNTDTHDGTLNDFPPMLYATKANDIDSPSLREILNMTDPLEREAWIQAMYLELDQLQDKGTYTIVDRVEAGDSQVVPSTWVFKRKRYPDGTIMKLKARFCVRGDRQWEVIDGHEETHAPVVEWGTLRILLSLMLNFSMHTTQIDFRNAFVQSDLPEPIFSELPPGPFRDNPQFQGKILKVFKSLYGDRRAPRLWFQHLKQHLTSNNYGFVPSTLDHYLFIQKGIIIVVYVDDAIVVSPDRGKIDKVLKQLEDSGFDVKDEGSLSNYLGLQISKLDDGSLIMQQLGLTDRILECLDLTESAPKETPATATIGKCKDDPQPTGTINYRSVVGMLMYLVGNTRPDCAFATHQCARFSHDPRLPHETALKRIGRYLKGTRDGGIILRPSASLRLDCYVDADFAGLWGLEAKDDPSSVKSRTGYYIMLGNVPVLWSSKLQTEIALSTMEAEYIALSTAMRAFLPLKHVLNELVQAFDMNVDPASTISTVFEDNQAALTLATQDPPRLTPRSKHIAVKYHWFRSHLGPDLKLKYISSNNQLADILTKPLTRIKFEEARKRLMGW